MARSRFSCLAIHEPRCPRPPDPRLDSLLGGLRDGSLALDDRGPGRPGDLTPPGGEPLLRGLHHALRLAQSCRVRHRIRSVDSDPNGAPELGRGRSSPLRLLRAGNQLPAGRPHGPAGGPPSGRRLGPLGAGHHRAIPRIWPTVWPTWRLTPGARCSSASRLNSRPLSPPRAACCSTM